MAIVAAADGSALGNPGPAGWAWYVDDERWQAGGWPRGTNNQGELMAVVALLDATAHLDDELLVYCDSQYVINSVTKWLPGWKRRGWRKADGSPVLNRELLARLDEALQDRTVRFEWVRGHDGHELNEAADARARAAAAAYQSGARIPSGPGWPGADAPRERPSDAGAAAPAAADPPPSGAVELDLFALEEPGPAEEVVALERALLDPAVRSSVERIDELLHPEFAEVGRSGRLSSREEVIELLGREYGSSGELEVLSADRVAPDVVLLVSRTAHDGLGTLRSSLWLREDGRWRVRFHQGTPEG